MQDKNKTTLNNEQAQQAQATKSTSRLRALQSQEYSDMVLYLFIAIFILELIVGGIAFFYGIINAIPDPNGGAPRFQFPWLAYGLAAILAPTGILLILHLSGVNVFNKQKLDGENDEAFEQQLPERLRKAYIIIKNAPTVVLLLGILLLGVGLVYVDGALNAIYKLSQDAGQFLPWIISAIVIVTCVTFMGRTWLAYRSKRLEEEYAFRREIFERTGEIIVDRGAMRLPSVEEAIALEGAKPLPLEQSKDDDIEDAEIIDVSHKNKQS